MRKKTEAKMSLEELIPVYGELKEFADDYKKKAEAKNKEIKAEMVKLLGENETSVDKIVDGWKANYSIRTSESLNEDAFIEFAKKHKQLASCIKTREYVDDKELEGLLYRGEISKKLVLEIDKFRISKSTAYLTISKVKEGS